MLYRLDPFAFAEAAKCLVNHDQYDALLESASRTGGHPVIDVGFDNKYRLHLTVAGDAAPTALKVTKFVSFDSVPWGDGYRAWGYILRVRSGSVFSFEFHDHVYGVIVGWVGRHLYTHGIIERVVPTCLDADPLDSLRSLIPLPPRE